MLDVLNQQFLVPKDAKTIKITALYRDDEEDQISAEQQIVGFYSANDFYVHVTTSTDEGLLGHNAVMHLKSNFDFEEYSYVVSIHDSTTSCCSTGESKTDPYLAPDCLERIGNSRCDREQSARC